MTSFPTTLKSPKQRNDITPGTVLAIGDVHGCYYKLNEILEPYFGTGVEVVFLGDLIDREPIPGHDLKVLKFVKKLHDNPKAYGFSKVTVLKGNHEQYLLRLKTNPSESFKELWLYNGGSENTLDNCDEYLPWLDSLPVKYIKGKYLFVHAGVKPNVAIKQQKVNDLLWIREDFLSVEDHGLPYVVVHGHTVQESLVPVVTPHRVSLDLGACFGGPLGHYEITPEMYEIQEVVA